MKQERRSRDYKLSLATEEDWGDVLRMSRAFHEESPYRDIPFSENKVWGLFSQYLSSDKTSLLCLLLRDGDDVCGLIFCAVTELYFSEIKTASEIVWWVHPDHRMKRGSLLLFQAYEFWANKVGAKFTCAVSTEGTTQLDKFYKRSGYSLYESTYVKQIKEL